MPACLVFGASGAVGRFLVPRLRRAGHVVIAISRTARTSADPQVRWVVGDLHGPMPELPPLDALFSLGPLDAFARWYAQARGTPPRVIAFSSMSVETKSASVDAAERALAQRLSQAERDLSDAAGRRGAALTLFRPTLIYGAGVDRSLTPIAQFAHRWRMFPRIVGAHGLRQPVHADDLAAACLAALEHPCTAARTYALGGGERLSFEAMLERVRAAMPVRTLTLPIPLAAARPLSDLAQKFGLPAAGSAALARLTRNLVADDAEAIADFAWTPRRFDPQPADWLGR